MADPQRGLQSAAALCSSRVVCLLYYNAQVPFNGRLDSSHRRRAFCPIFGFVSGMLGVAGLVQWRWYAKRALRSSK
jgi:hypothetical protein